MKGVTEGMVMAATPWRNNAEMIADCAKLGYLHKDWLTFDPTYGRGLWWTEWRPNHLVTSEDFRAIGPFDFRHVNTDDQVDAITYDPPYIAQGGRRTVGSGADDFVDRFGLDDCPGTPALLQELINDGLTEMFRLVKPGGFVLAKCKPYVSSGHLWHGDYFTMQHALALGFEVSDILKHIGRTGPQSQTRQVHARNNYSVLLVLRKPNPRANVESVHRNQAKKRSIIQEIKMGRGCADCGYDKHPAALDFDHRPGVEKLLNIGRQLSNVGIDRLLAEIEKCDVVCSNCHRIRTAERGEHVPIRFRP